VDVRTKYPSPHISYYKNGPHATVFCGVDLPGAMEICGQLHQHNF
jgi:hypothetical protein